MSPTGTNFGYPSTPVTTELWGKREGEKTHWEGEEKTNVFCVLLPWLAQAYAWNRCSVNTWGMYVQMNEKKELADRHLGREKKTWELWQTFPDYASTTSLYLSSLPWPWILANPSSLLPFAQVTGITLQTSSRYPDRRLEVDQAPQFVFRALESLSCGHKTF